ncbi:trk system potassium uptake protein TrkA [Clostridium sp. USBA 49]|uniref:cation:proton antiporter regulatory subunit n=1 Tax=Clostridium TaxID=1485 RepID=UPI00099A0784|nr:MULTISPECIES: TrkA C-terminal domain-containing protein [Clostridium]SKA78897.1 trk system potassium uptake protein TrkA [Clostridium sp. USBA 49]
MELSALSKWQGKSLGQLNMRKRCGINVLAIKHGNKINVSPKAEDLIKEEDIIICSR